MRRDRIRIAARGLLLALAGLILAALVASCAPHGAGSLESWPARDQLYRRYCALEAQKGAIPYAAFAACVHRLEAHRGDVCTHPGGGR